MRREGSALHSQVEVDAKCFPFTDPSVSDAVEILAHVRTSECDVGDTLTIKNAIESNRWHGVSTDALPPRRHK